MTRVRGIGGGGAGALTMIFLRGREHGVCTGVLEELEKEDVIDRRQLRGGGGGGGTLEVCR